MSVREGSAEDASSATTRTSKKRSAAAAELEVDVNAPEPPSKKALRKAKKVARQPDANPAPVQVDSGNVAPQLTKDDKHERSKYGVWIGNLSFFTTKKDLLSFLTSHGVSNDAITRLHMPPGNDHRAQNKGFAYVDFSSPEDLQQALQLSETLVGGRRLLIKDAKNFEGRPEKPKEKKDVHSHAPSRKIFIGNLDFDTTTRDLEKHFGFCGAISKTQMATFEDSGKSKGYAWVEFEQLSAAESAMKGWIEVSKPAKDQDTDSATRKVWLHRMGDRKLRLEYAEDATTRYRKRYGNESRDVAGERDSRNDPSGVRLRDSDSNVASGSSGNERRHDRPRLPDGKKPRAQRTPTSKSKKSGYGEETVQKMKGAIVEGTGSKVRFD